MARRRKPKGRPVNGVLVLDKPLGISSNAALQRAKRLFQAAKAGHTGSLDPLATGVLPLCFGEATKFSQILLDADKRYRARARLGVKTTTGDAEGEPLEEKPVPDLDIAGLKDTLIGFTGEIEQVPPMYSALKHNGQPLYKLAREGIEIERKSRKVTIISLELVELSDYEFEIEVHCTKGTYIRTLVEDIGDALGCGAHVVALRRLQSGPFTEEQALTLEQLEGYFEQGESALDQQLLPVSTAVDDWPKVILTDLMAHYFLQGQPVQVSGAPTEGKVRIFHENREFLGIGEIMDDGRVAPRRLLSQSDD